MEIMVGGAWPFNAFVMLRTTLSSCKLIKISMTCLYTKSEVKTNYTLATTAATTTGKPYGAECFLSICVKFAI